MRVNLGLTSALANRAIIVAVVGLLGATAACSTDRAAPSAPRTSIAAAPVPTGAAVEQLRWFVSVSPRLAPGQVPLPDNELRARFSDAAYRGLGGSAAAINAKLAPFADLTLEFLRAADTPTTAHAVVGSAGGDLAATVTVDADGRISGLLFTPRPAAPASWSQLDQRLRALAPRASIAVDEIDPTSGVAPRCRPVHGVDPDTRRPLGSAFKLYVLGALADAVRAGRIRWDDSVAVRDDWKSLPSGVLQNDPAGTRISYRRLADLMISISDNTAADHLINTLGRSAVQSVLTRFGNSDPAASTPFLTTRELFVLKTSRYPQDAQAYLATPPDRREQALSALADTPFGDTASWVAPREIDRLEWFGSPSDICRAFAGLTRASATATGAPVGAALSINDGGLLLSPTAFPRVWFKGGSEPGVLTLNYLAGTPDGRIVTVSTMISNPTAPIEENTVIPEIQSIIRGAVALAVAGDEQPR
ncbi:serine hydrolase [Williamsia sp. CHRR-6]|uniref:serine hydrolase n=1 Tax=Williamsia sp. CHRR-6 TaxID=2835871 RepID=UPI001BDA5DDA|nr:serine hydrolase [Williamsia sp. CHRR-6]MBT0566710.1 serine hydrolase [Williamsia sp. CHRR-6]